MKALINRMATSMRWKIQRLNISAWFEIVPPDFNSPDAPTGASGIPFPVRRQSKFVILEALRLWVESEDMGGDQFHQPRNNTHVFGVDGSEQGQL